MGSLGVLVERSDYLKIERVGLIWAIPKQALKIESRTGCCMHFCAGKCYNASRDVITFPCQYKNILVRYHYNNSEIYGVNRYTVEGTIKRFLSRS
jgi:hypothetical protein